MKSLPLFLLTGATLLTLPGRAEADLSKLPPPAATKGLTYAKDIKPIFDKSCIKCHGEEKQKGKLRLDTLEKILKGAAGEDAGEVLASRLLMLMRATRIPDGLSGVGYGPSDLEALVDRAILQKRLVDNAPLPIDRAAMRAIVFTDPAAKKRLEAILHPLIRAEGDTPILMLTARGEPMDRIVGGIPHCISNLTPDGWFDENIRLNSQFTTKSRRVPFRIYRHDN